jgi:hypothetical protein
MPVIIASPGQGRRPARPEAAARAVRGAVKRAADGVRLLSKLCATTTHIPRTYLLRQEAKQSTLAGFGMNSPFFVHAFFVVKRFAAT